MIAFLKTDLFIIICLRFICWIYSWIWSIIYFSRISCWCYWFWISRLSFFSCPFVAWNTWPNEGINNRGHLFLFRLMLVYQYVCTFFYMLLSLPPLFLSSLGKTVIMSILSIEKSNCAPYYFHGLCTFSFLCMHCIIFDKKQNCHTLCACSFVWHR